MLLIFLGMLETEDDKSKFVLLYEEYRYFLYHIAYSILHNKESAEDIVQQTFLKIIHNFKKITDVKSDYTKNLLAIIARNLSLNECKRQKGIMRKVINFDEIEMLPDTNTVEQLADVSDLAALIALLPEKYRDILQLMILYDHDYKRIAHEISISEQNARKRFERAKKMLRDIMLERGGELDDF